MNQRIGYDMHPMVWFINIPIVRSTEILQTGFMLMPSLMLNAQQVAGKMMECAMPSIQTSLLPWLPWLPWYTHDISIYSLTAVLFHQRKYLSVFLVTATVIWISVTHFLISWISK